MLIDLTPQELRLLAALCERQRRKQEMKGPQGVHEKTRQRRMVRWKLLAEKLREAIPVKE
jgi:hypothetical protein